MRLVQNFVIALVNAGDDSNLLYQMRVKLRAEKAGLVAVNMEAGAPAQNTPHQPKGRK